MADDRTDCRRGSPSRRCLYGPFPHVSASSQTTGFGSAFFRTPSLRQSRKFKFLFGAAIFALLFSLLLRPGLGGSRDWDLWSLGPTPYIVAALCWVAGGLGDSKRAQYVFHIIAVVGFFHVLPWVTVNHSAGLGLRDFRSMLVENPLWTNKRIAAGRAELAWLYSQQNDYAEAVRQIEEAISLAPKVGRYWRGLGTYYCHVGKTEEVEDHLLKAIDLDPKDGESHSKLGQLYVLQGRVQPVQNEDRICQTRIPRTCRDPVAFAFEREKSTAYRRILRIPFLLLY